MSTEHDTNIDKDDILIVDDESVNLKLLTEILVGNGYQVRPANRPQLAIDAAKLQPPKLILLDIKMPEMDGFEVCRQLKQDDRTREIPILFVSALSETRDKVTGFEVGGLDFISKPFDELEILARIRTHVNLRNLQLHMEEQVRERTQQVFESEARFRATFDQAAVGIAHVSPEGRFLRLNDKFCDIVGYDRAELLELIFQNITYPDDLDADLEQLKLLLDDEIKTYSMQKRYVRKSGNLVWANLTVSLVRDKAGQPEWFVAVIQDITAQKEAEEQLHIIKKSIDVSPDSAYWVDSKGTFVYVNAAACTGLGYNRDELFQMEIFDVDPALTKEMWPQFWDERRQLDVLHFESTHRRKDGSQFPVEISSVYIEFNGKEFLNGFARDISERKQAELAIRKSEQLARTLLNATTDLTQLVNEDGIILDLNDAMAESLRGTRGDLIGTCVFENFSPKGALERKNKIRQAIAEGKNIRFVDRSTPYVVFDTGIYPVTTPEGEKDQVVIFAHDITESEKMLQALQESETKFRRLVENVPDVIWTTDVTGKTIYISDNVQEIFGFTPEEVYALSNVWVERIHPDDVDYVMNEFTRLFQTGEMFDVEYRIKHKEGHWIWLHDRSMSIYRKDGFSYADGLFSDITFRKKAQQELQKSRDYLEHLISSIPDAVFSVKFPERIVEWASDSYNVLGEDLTEFIGKDSKCLYSKEEEYEAFGNKVSQAIREKKDYFITEATAQHQNGEFFPVEISTTIYREKGEPVSLTALVRDISERKKALEALKKSETLLKEAQSIARLGFWEWDLATNKLTWSDETYRIFGIDPGTPMTLEKLLEMIHPDDQKSRNQLMTDLIEGRDVPSFSYRIIRTDGSVCHLYGMGVRELDDRGVPIRLKGTLQDVTDIKTVEMAYRDSEDRLKEAQRIAQIGHWELDLLTNTLTWSEEIFRIFEIAPGRFEANYEAFLNAIHPDDRDMVDKAYTQSLEKRQPYKIDHRLLMPDGRIKYVQEQCETEYSPEGKPLRSVGTVQDITELKTAQNESMNLRLELTHLNRVMTMSELATSIAHEINQPLGAIMNNASAAKTLNLTSDEAHEELDEILEDISSDALRAGQIIRKVRGVMKPSDTLYGVMDINRLLDEVVNLYRNACRLEHIALEVNKEPGQVILVNGDQIRLQQVLMNLITNAMDSMAGSTEKILHVRSRYKSPDRVVVSVSDTGAGIGEKMIDKIFTPFYTTKKEGIGIGLRLCQSIIEEHGGRIWGENNLDGGATFSFSLRTVTEE